MIRARARSISPASSAAAVIGSLVARSAASDRCISAARTVIVSAGASSSGTNGLTSSGRPGAGGGLSAPGQIRGPAARRCCLTSSAQLRRDFRVEDVADVGRAAASQFGNGGQFPGRRPRR